MGKYSFIYHPIEKLHEIVPRIIPGIEKIITVHYDNNQKLISGVLTEKRNHEYSSSRLIIDKILPTLQKYMEENSPYDWYNKQNLPFEIEINDKSKTIDIFSELQNIVLLIRVPDELNQYNDLVFLYLNENPSNFGVTNSINPLTTDNKSIIAFLLYNTIKTFTDRQSHDREVLRANNSKTRQIINNTESLKYELQKTKENYGYSLVKLCQQYVKNWTDVTGKKYILSAGLLEKIKSYKGEIKNLEKIIEETVSYVDNLYLDDNEEIEILEWHLHFNFTESKRTDSAITDKKDHRYAKTLSLLDKLEKAALVVKSKSLKLTGTNVGQACPVPISAPAISDALYNHKSKINTLVELYPERWETLKLEFKPVMNIMRKE